MSVHACIRIFLMTFSHINLFWGQYSFISGYEWDESVDFLRIGRSRSMIGVLINFFWFLRISNIIHNNNHSFTLFPGLVNLRSWRKMDQKYIFFVKIGGRFRLIYGPEWNSTDLKIDLYDWKSLETFLDKY